MRNTHRWLTLILFILSSVAYTQTASAETYQTIRNNGDPQTTVDIVILGDGYTAAQMGKYHADVESIIQGFFSRAPFNEYQRYFNVHRIDVISNQSGVDHPLASGDGSCGYTYDFGQQFPKPGICKDTYLDASYGHTATAVSPSTNYLQVNKSTVDTVLSRTLANSQRDFIIVIANDVPKPGENGSNALDNRIVLIDRQSGRGSSCS